jgi:hypothetical protein
MKAALTHTVQKLPNAMQVAEWITNTLGPVPRSDASAVSIEISLIEADYTKTTRPRSVKLALILAALFVVASAVIAYLIVRA